MEIDVTPILTQNCKHLSGSQFELGPEAGKITWEGCLELAEERPLITDENRSDAQDHFAGYGTWEREEIEAWTDQELSAMVWQEAAADTRHFLEECKGDLGHYNRDCTSGAISGRLMIQGRKGKRTAIIYLGM